MARYMLLIWSDPNATAQLDEAAGRAHTDEYWAYDDALEAVGALVDSAPLEAPTTATFVAPGGVVTDGPFAEAAEVLAGYYLIDVADQAAAVEWAHQLPGVVRGFSRVEVRGIRELTRA